MKKRPNIFKPRVEYKPTEYHKADEFCEDQQKHHWLKSEIAMSSDIQDWHNTGSKSEKLSEGEKTLIGNVLKGFTQTELVVDDYWTGKICKWFPKPEIKAMATTFASFEVIHAQSYSMLNETLGFDDFSAFLEDEATRKKIENIANIKTIKIRKKDIETLNVLQTMSDFGYNDLNKASKKTFRKMTKILRSVAIFSAFTEGVNLFSSFAILFSFSMRGLMEGVAKIVEFSVRDESLHSNAGCWLFNTAIQEHPYLFTEKFKKQIKKAAKNTLILEFAFIDNAFELIEDDILLKKGNEKESDYKISKKHLKNFIKYRINQKLNQLNIESIYFDIDDKLLVEMSWFNSMTSGEIFTDFFAKRVTNYAKAIGNYDEFYMFEDFDKKENEE